VAGQLQTQIQDSNSILQPKLLGLLQDEASASDPRSRYPIRQHLDEQDAERPIKLIRQALTLRDLHLHVEGAEEGTEIALSVPEYSSPDRV
jgi:hypothetical protein